MENFIACSLVNFQTSQSMLRTQVHSELRKNVHILHRLESEANYEILFKKNLFSSTSVDVETVRLCTAVKKNENQWI